MVTYLFLSLIASLIIHFFSDYPIPLAGSSGYGLLGIYLFLIFKDKNRFLKFERVFIILFTVNGIIGTFIITGISKAGPFGGLTGGILLSLLIFSSQKRIKKEVNTND